jgi:hypothetical protein
MNLNFELRVVDNIMHENDSKKLILKRFFAPPPTTATYPP